MLRYIYSALSHPSGIYSTDSNKGWSYFVYPCPVCRYTPNSGRLFPADFRRHCEFVNIT